MKTTTADDPLIRGQSLFRLTEPPLPKGLRSASAVYEVTVSKSWFRLLPEELGGGIATAGQAIALDLATGPVFVVMNAPTDNEGMGALATKTFCPELTENKEFVQAARYINLHFWGKLKVELPKQAPAPFGGMMQNWPVMVRFRDMKDPASIEQVDASKIGVKRIWLQATRDPISTGLEKRLLWLKQDTVFFKPDPKVGLSVPLSSLNTAQKLRAKDFDSRLAS